MLTSTRSACDAVGAPYWLGELQAGHGYVGMFASHMTAADARHYTWHPLAHGAKGLCFYAWYPMSSGYESGGFGMANLDGTPSDRALAAGEVTRQVTREMELFLRGKPTRAEAAVCWDVNANVMWECMREKSHYVPSRSYIGAYRALFQEDLPADYVHPQQIAEGKLADYKVLALPFAFALPAPLRPRSSIGCGRVASSWRRRARRGTTRLATVEMRCPASDWGRSSAAGKRGPRAWTRILPCACASRANIRRSRCCVPGTCCSGARFREALEPLSPTAEVVAEFEDGSPAIVVNRWGAGWGVFVGSLLSLGFYKFGDENAGKVLKGLTQLAGLHKPVLVSGAPPRSVEPRLLEGTLDDGRRFCIFFAFNHTDASVAPEFHVALPPGEYAAEDIATQSAVSVRWQDGRLMLRKSLAPQEIWVVKVEALE